MSDRGERLVRALRADPTLLFEICTELDKEKVAGPWVQSDKDHTKRLRRAPGGRLLAVVRRHETRNFNPWESSVTKKVGLSDDERPEKNHQTQGDALDWCDARLLERGYQLAEKG